MADFVEKNNFCLYLSSFTALNNKDCLLQILIYLWICSFSNLLRKTNFLSISKRLSEIVTFLTKNSGFQWNSPKMLQNNRKAWFSCMWPIFKRKSVFLKYLTPFTGLIKNNCLNISKYFSGFVPFQTCYQKNKFSEYFSAPFRESQVIIEIPQTYFKTTEKLSLWKTRCIWLIFRRKTDFVYIWPGLLLSPKRVVYN